MIESWSDPCSSAISELLSLIPSLHSQLLKPHSEPRSTLSKYMTSHPYDLTAIEQFLSSTSSSTEDRVMLQPHSNIEDTNGMSFSELFRLVYTLTFTRDRGIKSREGQTSPFRKGWNPRGVGHRANTSQHFNVSAIESSRQPPESWELAGIGASLFYPSQSHCSSLSRKGPPSNFLISCSPPRNSLITLIDVLQSLPRTRSSQTPKCSSLHFDPPIIQRFILHFRRRRFIPLGVDRFRPIDFHA